MNFILNDISDVTMAYYKHIAGYDVTVRNRAFQNASTFLYRLALLDPGSSP